MLDSWMYDNDSIFCKLQVMFVNRNFKRAATRNAYVLMIPAIAPTAFSLPAIVSNRIICLDDPNKFPS